MANWTRWTDDDKVLLHDPDIPAPEVAARTGHSIGSVYTYRSAHGIAANPDTTAHRGGTPGATAWTDQEDAILISHADDPPATVAAILGRTPKAVRSRRSKLIAAGRITPRKPRE